MSFISPECDALVDLMAQTMNERHERFDPVAMSASYRERPGDEGQVRLFLKETKSFPNVPNVGPLTVAVYQDYPPEITRQTTRGYLHHGCEEGVLLRRPETDEEDQAAERLGQQRGLGPKHAWVFEKLVHLKDQPGTFLRSTPTRRKQTAVFIPN